MERLSVEGIDPALEAAEERQDKAGGVFILFCGSVQQGTGDSWCPDCVKGEPGLTGGTRPSTTSNPSSAEPVIEKIVGEQKSGVFIRCSVGERDE